MKLLIPVSDPKANNSWALQAAAYNGCSDIVELLIPLSDPKAIDSEALMLAARAGHLDVVKLLIPVSDPKANESLALFAAVQKEHIDMTDLLLFVTDYHLVLHQMITKNYDIAFLKERIEIHEVVVSKNNLSQELDIFLQDAPHSVKRKL